MPHVHDVDGHLAGSDADRLADLHAAIAAPDVDAIWCARGGYGSQRLVDAVDVDLLRRHPTPLIGYSDITALHLAWRARAGIDGVHGPTAEARPGRLAPADWDAWAATLRGAPLALEGATTLVGGTAEGPLVGGNLSLVASTIGTADERALDGAVLLLEDVGEAPYRLDRMMVHLRRAGVLARVVGVVLGGFTACEDRRHPTPTAEEVVAAHLRDLGLPSVTGWSLGHGAGQRAVPLGGWVRLDATAGTLHG